MKARELESFLHEIADLKAYLFIKKRLQIFKNAFFVEDLRWLGLSMLPISMALQKIMHK